MAFALGGALAAAIPSLSAMLASPASAAIGIGLPLLGKAVPAIARFAAPTLANKMPPSIGKYLGFGSKVIGEAVEEFGQDAPKTAEVARMVVDAVKPVVGLLESHPENKRPFLMGELPPEIAAGIEAKLLEAEGRRRAASANLDKAMDAAEGKNA